MNIKYKLGEVAKDLNKPNKEVIELLSKYTGEPRKSVSVLSEDELNYVFEYYTQKNQLQNINDYFNATSTPPQPKQEKAPAPAKKKPAGDKKPAEKHAAPQSAPTKKKEEKAAQKPAKKQPEKPVTTGKEKQEAKAKFDAARFETAKKRTEAPQPKNKPAAKQKPKKEATAQNFNTNMGDSKNFEQQMRHVDTSKMEINLDKYNEKYDRIAPSNSTKQYANATRKQKFANKNAQRQKAKYSNKRETEAQKLQRLEL